MDRFKKLHYAWKVVIACIFIKIGTGGATACCMSSFVTPIVTELGCKVSELTLYTSINAITMALLYTTAARVIGRRKIGLIMGVASCGEVLGILLMAFYREVHLFYISGALIGASQAFNGFVALPIIINMWFKKKSGMVLGTVTAVGSGASVLYGLLSGQLITSFGWRTSYLILAAMAFILTVPVVFRYIRKPDEVGVAPYGAEESQETGEAGNASDDDGHSLTKKQAFRMPMTWIAWISCILFSYGCGVAYYVATFSTMELGQSTNFGARAYMMLSLGAILSSLVTGKINDRYGVRAGLVWGMVTTVAGYAAMFLSFSKPAFVYPAIFIVGLGSCMYMVQCPLMARSIVGTKHYPEIWSLMMMANSLIGGGLYSTIGLFYDNTGTYRGAFVMAMILYVAASLLGILAVRMSDNMKKQINETV